MNNVVKGAAAQVLAERYLKSAGCTIVERNYRCRFGEVDLIVREGRTLRFVEVKGRWSGRAGSPLEQLTPPKKRHIVRVAAYYLNRFPRYAGWRITFSALGISWEGGEPHIDWVPEAFAGEGWDL